jgi:hypothetical protein
VADLVGRLRGLFFPELGRRGYWVSIPPEAVFSRISSATDPEQAFPLSFFDFSGPSSVVSMRLANGFRLRPHKLMVSAFPPYVYCQVESVQHGALVRNHVAIHPVARCVLAALALAFASLCFIFIPLAMVSGSLAGAILPLVFVSAFIAWVQFNMSLTRAHGNQVMEFLDNLLLNVHPRTGTTPDGS